MEENTYRFIINEQCQIEKQYNRIVINAYRKYCRYAARACTKFKHKDLKVITSMNINGHNTKNKYVCVVAAK